MKQTPSATKIFEDGSFPLMESPLDQNTNTTMGAGDDGTAFELAQGLFISIISMRFGKMNITKSKLRVFFAQEELGFLSNATNESGVTLEEWEIQTRTGETLERAMEIHTNPGVSLEEAKQL